MKPNIKMADLNLENPYMLLMLGQFGLDQVMHDKTVKQLYSENRINEKVFIPLPTSLLDFSHLLPMISYYMKLSNE